MHPKVDAYFLKIENREKELRLLREILLDCELIEELKWGSPCYRYQKTNIIIIGGFKEYCVISFLKGSLLLDEKKILVSPGENSQSVRYLKFTNIKEITKLERTIKEYIFEAIEIERAGLKVELKLSKELKLCEELQNTLNKNKAFKKAFEALTPGRQRGYNLFFSAPKQSKTKEDRIEKYTKQILDGYGINDCVCGLSKKMPGCDGSHKFIKTK